ncbi:MAG: PAS domain-containing protein [Woeseiaceae bacterium]|nr:PAS domain-containing protein [Woeseiaceae bacterium]
MITVVQIAENLLLLSLMGLAYFLIEVNRRRFGTTFANALKGICFGLAAALVTAVPVTLGDGATIDARAGPVIIAGIAAGPVGAAIAGLMGAVARGFVGGSFALSGMIVYAVYALAGVLLERTRIVVIDSLPRVRSVALIVFASLAGAASMFFLIRPFERAVAWLANDLPFILFANTMSVIFTAAAISIAVVYVRKSVEVIEVNETLDLAKRALGFGIWDYDFKTENLKWDDRSLELHGVPADAFKGRYEDWSQNVHPDDLAGAQDAFRDSLEKDVPFDIEYRVVHPDGSMRWIKGDAIIVRDADGQPVRVVGSNVDLTAMRKAEQELKDAQALAAQAQKIETVGQLTGGVAHDFNNLLAVILGNLELLMARLEEEGLTRDDSKKYIEDCIEAAQRGADLTHSMLSYARKAQLNPVAVDVNETVLQTRKWISRTMDARVRIETHLEPQIWSVLADRGSLQSALVNLLVNARDAIEDSGRIVIETANVELDEARANSYGLTPGRYVSLTVTDDGVGVSAEYIERIFDPFFTTKAAGEGTGLGLSMVQGFVKQSNGAIQVESDSEAGTTFHLFFPATYGDAVGRDESAFRSEASATVGRGPAGVRVLLVEDQREVRTVLEEMLSSAGYRVETAESGDEALELLDSDESFDLIVSDVVMPGELQGPSLARAVRERNPRMPFVFLTGYNNLSDAAERSIDEQDACLIKPVRQEQLLEAIRKRVSADA